MICVSFPIWMVLRFFSHSNSSALYLFHSDYLKAIYINKYMGNSCSECLPSTYQQHLKNGQQNLKSIEWIEKVKKGSLSNVWVVRKKGSDKQFVLKVTEKLRLVDRGEVSTIINEKNIMETIDSPFVVNFINSFQDREKLYILMEYMPHGNLRELLNKTTFSESQIRNYQFQSGFIILCVLFGLTHLHHHKILHLDLKPENIVIDEQKYARICDFGLSKFLESKPKKKLLGTFGYQAPQLFFACDSGNKELMKKQVDYFSLGVVGCEMLLGNNFRVREGVEKQKMRELLWGKASPECVDFLLKLIEPNPKKRLGSGRTKQIWKHPWIKLSSQEVKKYRAKKIISPLEQQQFSRMRMKKYRNEGESDESLDEIYCNLLFKQANFQKMFIAFEPKNKSREKLFLY